MNKSKLILVATALTLPLLTFSVGANAATAHNLQTGARTQNSYDTKMTARMKQRQRMMMMHRHRRGY